MVPDKILLVQLYSNGDCLYATAVARQIKKDFPQCVLTWAISIVCKNIILNNPYVDEIMVIDSVAKNDEKAFRKFLFSVHQSKSWNTIIVTQISGKNQAHYDGCIRSAIFRGYQFPLKGNVQPVLRLTTNENQNVVNFAQLHHLSNYRKVVLFEFAPLSGQSALTPAQAMEIAERLILMNAAVILSSANKITHLNPAIIDGSNLSIRETAGLTHFCSFLIGCSSGITWLSTSDAGKRLPMVQLLNPRANWINPISRDFSRFEIDDTGLIELYNFNTESVIECVNEALVDFEGTKRKYHQQLPLHFKTTISIVYNLLCYLEFRAIFKHIRVNRQVYGTRLAFYKEVATGFLIFPFRLTYNFFRKGSKIRN